MLILMYSYADIQLFGLLELDGDSHYNFEVVSVLRRNFLSVAIACPTGVSERLFIRWLRFRD